MPIMAITQYNRLWCSSELSALWLLVSWRCDRSHSMWKLWLGRLGGCGWAPNNSRLYGERDTNITYLIMQI